MNFSVRTTTTENPGTWNRTGVDWNTTLFPGTEERAVVGTGSGTGPGQGEGEGGGQEAGDAEKPKVGEGVVYANVQKSDDAKEGYASVVVTHGETVIKSSYSVDQLTDEINDTHWQEKKKQGTTAGTILNYDGVNNAATKEEALKLLETAVDKVKENHWKKVSETYAETNISKNYSSTNQTFSNLKWESTNQKHINDSIKLMASANSEAEIVGESVGKTVAKREVWPSHVAREQEGGQQMWTKVQGGALHTQGVHSKFKLIKAVQGH